ncbi:4bffd209-3ffa-4398-819f-306869d0c093 [Sclerotinia trifoliorum]|uniref:chitinase n=1 Tax=Sclerotinia trifoliorum TaxID=28548 RepID=A0A8H2ZMY1_9HELO|nr:4bffd209-3ffa-4398-819f-306869d0c093 [Sclerotinia trifoliorum]
MYSTKSLIGFASMLASLPSAFAGFSTTASNNVAIYWGQGPNQGTLASYCSSADFDIIPVAFLISINKLTVNVGNADPTQVGKDIVTCQGMGKTILLSIGGATYTENELGSSAAATTAAKNVWAAFGPKTSSSTTRPFGDAVVDGFDFDIETQGLTNLDVFAQELRSLSDAETSKKYYLTAAPQCPYPDQADKSFLQGAVSFDAVFVQFYNNDCGLNKFVKGSSTQSVFNMATWDKWASSTSKNKNVKVFVGIPGSSSAATVGYVDQATMTDVINYSKTFKSFGGVMAWDMVTLIGNSGYLASINKALGGTPASGSAAATTSKASVTSAKASSTAVGSTFTTKVKSTITSAKAVATATATRAADGQSSVKSAAASATSTSSSGTVAQWSQCGGEGYTGPTECDSGTKCVRTDDWWSACE